MHLRRADLHFKRLATGNDGSMERLIPIGSRERNEILDSAGDGPPGVVDDTQRRIAVPDIIGDDPKSSKS
jgi:hypothetical protein